MDSYTKIVSSKFIVDFPMVLLGHLQYSIKLELNCFLNVKQLLRICNTCDVYNDDDESD